MPRDYGYDDTRASREPMRRKRPRNEYGLPAQDRHKQPQRERRTWTNYDEYIAAQRRFFEEMKAKPANYCTLCGYPMDYNGHKPTEWELTWSTHEPCRDSALRMLDRESGIARERRQFANRDRHR